jgi:hypothetical protein
MGIADFSNERGVSGGVGPSEPGRGSGPESGGDDMGGAGSVPISENDSSCVPTTARSPTFSAAVWTMRSPLT